MAATILREISKDEHERARIRSRRMYEMDKYSDYHTAIEIGELRSDAKWQTVVADKDAVIADNKMKIAEIETKLNNKEIAIARNALAKGSTPEFIHEITGLDLEIIKKLKKSKR